MLTIGVQAATNAAPAPAEDVWVLTIGGAGATTTTGDTETAFGANISIGRTGELLLPYEAGIRQGFGYSSSDDSTVFSTRLYGDWTLLKIQRLDVFAGGTVGITYGSGVDENWVAGPEAGVRYWLKDDVALVGRIDYLFDLNNSKAQDRLNYGIGVQVTF
jgi:hypothetical protein